MAPKSQIGKYATQSAFIFSGKVVKSKAATLQGLPTDNTLIVQVNHITKAPDMFKALTGQEVTVRFNRLPQLRTGANITVFANGWIFGNTLAVDAVGYVEETEKRELAERVQQAQSDSRDEELKERLDNAELGVVGKVVKVEKKEVQTTHISEHDPNWHEATINVDEVVKGKKNTKEVKVVFPQSDDVRWHKFKKFSEGQQGIWLLQKGTKQNPKGIPPKVMAAIPQGKDILTTLHPVDFLSLNELGKVKSLLK